MPESRIRCPECAATLRVDDDGPSGAEVECPKCGTTFTPADVGPVEDRPRPKKRKKKAEPKSNAALYAGIAAGVLLLIGGGVAAVMALRPAKKTDPVAAAPTGGGSTASGAGGTTKDRTPSGTPTVNAVVPPKSSGTAPKAGSGKDGLEKGDTAMEIDGEDIDGKKFKLSDYRGKVVVLDFWGHW